MFTNYYCCDKYVTLDTFSPYVGFGERCGSVWIFRFGTKIFSFMLVPILVYSSPSYFYGSLIHCANIVVD